MSLEYKVLGQDDAAEIVPQTAYFVAEGTLGTTEIAKSTDLLSWQVSTTPIEFFQIAVGNNLVAIKDHAADTVAVSTDGVSWTVSTIPSTSWLKYVNNRFFVINETPVAQIASSTDGITWTSLSSLPYPNGSIFQDALEYGNSRYLMLEYTDYGTFGNSNRGAISTDGITWTATTMPVFAVWTDVAFGDGKFVAINFVQGGEGEGEGEGDPSYAYISTDGITWTQSSSSVKGTNIVYGNGIFVSSQNFFQPYISYSTDGSTWTPSAWAGTGGALDKLVFADNHFITMGRNSSSIARSTDAVTWELLEFSATGINSQDLYGFDAGNILSPLAKTQYTVPSTKEAIISSIYVANNTASSQTYSVAVVPNGEALSPIHYIRKNVAIDANDFQTIDTKLTLSEGDQIITEGSSDEVSINMFGVEK